MHSQCIHDAFSLHNAFTMCINLHRWLHQYICICTYIISFIMQFRSNRTYVVEVS